jgi:hypothetical protein
LAPRFAGPVIAGEGARDLDGEVKKGLWIMQSRSVVGVLGALVLVLTFWGTAGEARADATCTPVVANHVSSIGAGWYDFELTIHRTDVELVSYTRGFFMRNGTSTSWPLKGEGQMYFSDRFAGNQRFNVNAADALDVYISSTGQLHIWSRTWSFATSWDLGCSGNTFTKIIPGHGVVTLTLRGWNAPIG